MRSGHASSDTWIAPKIFDLEFDSHITVLTEKSSNDLFKHFQLESCLGVFIKTEKWSASHSVYFQLAEMCYSGNDVLFSHQFALFGSIMIEHKNFDCSRIIQHNWIRRLAAHDEAIKVQTN